MPEYKREKSGVGIVVHAYFLLHIQTQSLGKIIVSYG